MATRVELDAEDEAAAEEAFDDFNPTDSEIEDVVEGDEEEEGLDTGGETLDDGPAEKDDGSATNGDDEGAEARTDAAPKGERTRDETGKFKKGEAPDAKAGTEVKKPEAPKWEKFAVAVDRRNVPIDEALVTKSGDHHILAIKSTDFPRFQQRMGRAVLADQMWRPLNEAVAELEEARALVAEGPKQQTDGEIEAQTIIEYLNEEVQLTDGTKTTRMALAIPDPRELTWLTDRVKRRQLEYKQKYETDKTAFVTKRQETRAAEATESSEPETQLRGIASIVLDFANEQSDNPQEIKDLFKGVTEAEMKAVYGALVPLRRSLYWKEGKEWFADTQLIYNTARQEIAKLRAAATPGKPGTPATTDKTRRGERLNKGSSTTSLKTKRAPLDPAKRHPRGSDSEAKENSHTRAQRNEDSYRKATRSYMNSPGFDLGDDDEE